MPGRRTAEQPDRVLTLVARVLAKFIQDHVLRPPIRILLSLIDDSEVFPFRTLAHDITPESRLRPGLHLKEEEKEEQS